MGDLGILEFPILISIWNPMFVSQLICLTRSLIKSPAVKAQAAQAPNSNRVPRRSQSETPEGVKAKPSIPTKVGEAKWIDGNV